jgi:uncharacterized protein with HEPN domain
MPRDYKAYLDDILQAVEKITQYTWEISFQTFSGDDKTIDAVVRNLEVIGEAVKHIPKKVRSRYPDIEWQRITNLRNIIVHEYFGINLKIIWDIVKNKLPVLAERIKQLLED